MLHIDLVCDAELRPRLRLLQQHMQTLGVDLHLHTEIPEDLPPVLIVAPVPDSSLKLNTLEDAEAEIVALYLERQLPACTAAYEVHIPSWPARSSDPDVEALARYLTAPRVTKKFQEARRRQQIRARRQRKSGRNLLVLLVLVLLFAGLTQLELNENKPADETGVELAETQIPSPAESQVPLNTTGEAPDDQAEEKVLPPARQATEQITPATDAPTNQIEVAAPRVKALDNSRVDSSLDWITAPCQVEGTQEDGLKQTLAHTCVACRSIQP
ncbi:MAG: hypothetical protein RIC89_22625 [Pseudomonadales bacterium]